MLDFLGVVENTWMPPSLSADEIDRLCMDHLMSDKSDMDFLVIIKIEPYIDSLYIHYDDRNDPFSVHTKRFTFNEGFRWGASIMTNCIVAMRRLILFLESILKNITTGN